MDISKIKKLFNHKMHKLPDDLPSIAIAVSGGPDSMLLCYLANEFYKNTRVTLHALIVDHKLRAESTVEASSSASFLEKNGFKIKISTWSGPKPKSNLQALAREERYKLLTNYCLKNKISYLLTGHHQDDQAETILLRISRGSGIDGISGIPLEGNINGINVFRPLLEVDKASILASIKSIGWPFHEDPSNHKQEFDRVKFRKFLSSPQWSFLKPKLLLLANNAHRASDYLKASTIKFLKRHCEFTDYGHAILNLEPYLLLHEEIALRSLSLILKTVSGKNYPPRLEQLKRIRTALINDNFKNCTLWGCKINLKNHNLKIIREAAAIKEKLRIIKPGETLIWDNRFKITSQINCKVWFLPRHNYKKTLFQLTGNKNFPISSEIISTLPIIYDKNGEIIAIPGIYNNPKAILKFINKI